MGLFYNFYVVTGDFLFYGYFYYCGLKGDFRFIYQFSQIVNN